MADTQEVLTPTYVPEELKVPYDILDIPSQGILYSNKKSSVKVEFLTAMDENILSSPNIVQSGKLIDVLLERKVKYFGFDTLELIEGDRTAILIYLRTTGFGEEYHQLVNDPKTGNLVEGTIDLTQLTQKKLTIKPDKNGEFDYTLPLSKKKVKFRFLNGKDENEIDIQDISLKERSGEEISFKPILRLEKSIMEIDGVRDKIKLSNIVRHLTISDSRQLNKYIRDIEPGIDLKTTARIQGGESVPCFLKFGLNFFWPEL